jgi:hypothetical protein
MAKKNKTLVIKNETEFTKHLTPMMSIVKSVKSDGVISKKLVTDEVVMKWLTKDAKALTAIVRAVSNAKKNAIASGDVERKTLTGVSKLVSGKVEKAKVNFTALRKVAIAQMKRVANINSVKEIFTPHISKRKSK